MNKVIQCVAGLLISISQALAVNIRGCEDFSEYKEFSLKVEAAKSCKKDSDCTVQKFRGIDSGYGPGVAVSKTEIDKLLIADEKLPTCAWGLCECLIMELDKVVCVDQRCGLKFKGSPPEPELKRAGLTASR